MENAVDAIKIAFGILVFVIALVLAVSVVGQARATSEMVFHVNDKTEFYEYVTSDNIGNNITQNSDRIVGLDTMLPAIHRYAKEQFAVTIFDSLGNPIVRYDLWTENIMPNWNRILKNKHIVGSNEERNYNDVQNRLQRLQNVVNKTINTNRTVNAEDDISNLYRVSIEGNHSINVGAPWEGSNEEILKRIHADMTGKEYNKNLITYTGKNLKQYQNRKFIEKFLEISTRGETITDDEYSIETIKENKKLEIIYILQD